MRKLLFALLLLPAACGERDAGLDAYRDGRFRDAHEAFRKAAEAVGDDASAELSYNRALAALRAGDLSDAESSAKRAAGRGEPEITALCDFLLGNAAFARCETAERQAITAAAEPFAFDVAIVYARKARRLWQDAAMSRSDWPEARRNVERALLKLEELERKKAEAADRRRREADRQPRPRPRPPEPRGTEEEPDPALEPLLKELTQREVMQLLEKLGKKEEEKLALRRSYRKQRMAEVERDW